MVWGPMRVLVTGATGFIGSHVVEALLGAGHEPYGAVRRGSDRTHLDSLGVSTRECDVTDPASLRVAFEGLDCVVHTAALVSAYGAWEPYRRVGVEGTKNVVEAAIGANVPRFLHLGSIAVYGFQHADGAVLSEGLPIATAPEPWNHYVREKALSERIVWKAHDTGRLAATSIRPSVVLGPRDRAVVRRMHRVLRSYLGGLIGRGDNRVGCVVVDDLAQLVVRAIENPRAIGRTYNASGQRPITQADLTRAYAEAFGTWLPPWRVPYRLAITGAAALDELYATIGRTEEPIFSRFSAAILGRDFTVDCSRAREELGWQGRSDYVDAIRASVAHHQSS
jgi:2-alkyl-3-oxoalkanoate reductase